MPTQRYIVTPRSIETIISWVTSREIAIPEIQRPFVWNSTKVRNLLDSLYQGYPIGYLIVWCNPDVKLKDGLRSHGKKILIDGQQRVTALMAALLGQKVLDKNYNTMNIKIAYNPIEESFEVSNAAIQKDLTWIQDIASVFSHTFNSYRFVTDYCNTNSITDPEPISDNITKLLRIKDNQIGVIELDHELDIETVTEIFIRVNSAGVELSQADFAMSKIAVNETYGGNLIRKAIDYFCHLAVNPEFYRTIEHHDKAFVDSEYYPKMKWLKDTNNDIYDPKYTDMLRVAFTSQFTRGKLQDLVALLSGRDFATHDYSEEISEESFNKLKIGIMSFMDQTSFERFVMIISSAGFINGDLIGGSNAVNFAYIVYLRARSKGIDQAVIESLVRRWYAMSILRGRYTGSPETIFDSDIRQIDSQGLEQFINSVLETELPDSYWTGMLPQLMDTSSSQSPYWYAFLASQVKLNDRGFLSSDITVKALLELRGDVHHVYPRDFLKQQGIQRGQYNQIANFVLMQSEINIAISNSDPAHYFYILKSQCNGGEHKYGGIRDIEELKKNLAMNCIPESMLEGPIPSYDEFLKERRKLMALRLKDWFSSL